MQRPGDASNEKEDVPWMLKYAGRGLGTVGGLSKSFNMFSYLAYVKNSKNR